MNRLTSLWSGLQKITKLGKPRQSVSAWTEVGTSLRPARRMSDVDIDVRRGHKKEGSAVSEELSTRPRRVLVRGGGRTG